MYLCIASDNLQPARYDLLYQSFSDLILILFFWEILFSKMGAKQLTQSYRQNYRYRRYAPNKATKILKSPVEHSETKTTIKI